MSPAATREEGFDLTVKGVPATEQRRPFIPKDGDEKLKYPGTPRANLAASVEAPYGTEKDDYTQRNKHLTVLQQHLAFFDRDNDGIIWPHDTFIGFYRLGYGLFLSILSVLIIHINFSYPTVPGWLPDPFFRVFSAGVHKDKHGSDSGTYDHEGRFTPQKFEDIFAKYSTAEDKQTLTVRDVMSYMWGQWLVLDPFGWGGSIFEWVATWILIARDGKMYKDDIRRVYDGSIFYEIAARREKRRE